MLFNPYVGFVIPLLLIVVLVQALIPVHCGPSKETKEERWKRKQEEWEARHDPKYFFIDMLSAEECKAWRERREKRNARRIRKETQRREREEYEKARMMF